MKKLFPILTLCLAIMCMACDHQEEVSSFNFDQTCWFDGYEFFVCSPDTVTNNPDLLIFSGGTLHEGGSTFALLKVAVDTFVIQPFPGEDWTAVGVAGDTVVRHQLGDQTILVCYRPDDPEADTLRMFDPGNKTPIEAYHDLLIQQRLNVLNGTYWDEKHQTTYTFANTLLVRTDAKGTSDTQTFSFFYSFDMPSRTLILSNQEKLWYEPTPAGLDIYNAKYWITEDDYTRSTPVARLVRQ